MLIGEQKAIAAGAHKQRTVDLQVKLEQARILAQTYAQEQLAEKMKATDKEVDDYVAAHPELDTASRTAQGRRSVEASSSRRRLCEAGQGVFH